MINYDGKQLLVTLTVADLTDIINNVVKEQLVKVQPAPANDKKDLLTLNELCSEYGFKKNAVYWQTHKKTIPYVKINCKNFFSRKEIELWLKSNTIPTLDD